MMPPSSVVITMIASATTFGRMWRSRILMEFAPLALAASMYWLFFSDSTAPRMMRTTPGITARLNAKTIVRNDGPSTCVMISSSSNAGNAMAVSTVRWITESTTPPKYPEAMPINRPMTPPPMTEIKATESEMRPPYTKRLKMSRPTYSVPKMCAAEIPSSGLPAL
jgi:hypothetical protein